MVLEDRLSAEFIRRSSLLKFQQIPNISELQFRLSRPLFQVVLQESPNDLRKKIGVVPPLKGPEGDLWQSPSDLLQGKVALTPPLTQKHVKALTHKGILEIGAAIEEKFENDQRIKCEKAMKAKEESLRRLFEAEKETLTADLRKELTQKFYEQIADISRVYDEKICQILYECGKQIEQLEEQMAAEINSLNEIWQMRLDDAVHETTVRLTEEFFQKLTLQEQTIVAHFQGKLDNARSKNLCILDFERQKNHELMLQIKHQLECQNIANLMYMLCKERRKCTEQKTALEDDHKKVLQEKNKILREKRQRIKALTRSKEIAVRKLRIRERCLREVLKQFQKFIYYALKAAPTQGEFLLNLSKFLQFELRNYGLNELVKSPERGTKIAFDVPETMEIKGTIKAKTPEELTAYSTSSVLPAFCFSNKMYVREDFRDKIAAGIPMDPSNTPWNEDVEELLKIFKQSMEDLNLLKLHKNRSQMSSSVHFTGDDLASDSITSPPKVPEARLSLLGNIQATSSEKELEIRKISLLSATLSVKNGQSVKIQSDDDTDISIAALRKAPSKLIQTRDSLILHMSQIERKSQMAIGKKPKTAESVSGMYIMPPSQSNSEGSIDNKTVQVLTKKDSNESGENSKIVCMFTNAYDKPEDTPSKRYDTFSQTSDLQVGSRGLSKLLLATDSFEIIRSTVGLNTMKETQQKPIELSTWTPPPPPPKPSKTPRVLTKIPPPRAVRPPKNITPRRKVLGDRTAVDFNQPSRVFTQERIKDLVDTMKGDPTLIGLFTPCSK